jgi:hypothetical protein
MQIIPIVPDRRRIHANAFVRLATSPLRAVMWIIGAVLGSIVAGFVQGWRDAP